jgi:hypothetical protein
MNRPRPRSRTYNTGLSSATNPIHRGNGHGTLGRVMPGNGGDPFWTGLETSTPSSRFDLVPEGVTVSIQALHPNKVADHDCVWLTRRIVNQFY